jgi:CO/xanthine dehydrogenase FAD-binding subunit
MTVAINYERPRDLAEAIDFLARHGAETKIIAGGTDVMVDLRAKTLGATYLLDVSRLAELKGIERVDGELHVGAGVTISEIESSPILAQDAPALQKCALTFASRQIRNVATIGGNVAHCSPCGDTVPPLVIHEAQVVLAGEGGRRRIPIETVAAGPYACSLPSDALIVKFILKPARVDFAAFQKIGRRRALAIARMSLAAMLRRDAQGRINFMRLSLGACTPTPQRMQSVEELLTDRRPTEALLWEAGALLAEEMIRITGRRSSAVYKEPAVQGLFLRMLYPVTQHENRL